MVSPIKSVIGAVGRVAEPVTSALGRAVTMPGAGGAGINIPAAPPPIAPAQQPTAKPARKGMQQTFLSGVAGSALQGAGAGGTTGKTLLGA